MASNTRDSPPRDNILATVKARQRTLRLKRCGSPSAGAVTTPSSAASAPAPAVATSSGGTSSNGGSVSNSSSSAAAASTSASAGAKRTGPYGWTVEEKLFFFEALRLFGKSFPEVSRHIRRRVRRFSMSFKSREQCRLFYYRTWQYVKKYIRIVPEVPNLTMELYGLINYAVIYSRFKNKLNPRLGEKLNELVQTGFTMLRFRGKRLVLRTPCCPSLKRLNGIEDPKQEYRVSETLQLELTPRTNASFHRVQGCAQNPAVRLFVSANRQLGEVLSLLETKWRSSLARLRQQLRLPVKDAPRLSVRLPEGTSLEDAIGVATVARCRYQDISLDAYLDRLRRVSTSVSAGPNGVLPQTASAQMPPVEDDPVRLELVQVGRLVMKGVDVEAASRVKILALYLALGCPPKIQLEYDYLSPSEMVPEESPRNLFNNAMRRLLHLCRTQQTTFKTMDEEVTKLKEEKEAIAAQFERSRRASCASCGCVPEELDAEGAGLTNGASESSSGGAGGSGPFRRPRAVYPRRTPSEQALREKALQQLTTVTSRAAGPNGRARSGPIVVQRELQIDANTEPEMKPVCAAPLPPAQAVTVSPALSDMAVLRDRVRRQQPLIMHRGQRAESQQVSRMVTQQLMLKQQQQHQQKQQQLQERQQQLNIDAQECNSNSSHNVIHRAFRIAMQSGEESHASHDSIESMINKIGASSSRSFQDLLEKSSSLPPPTPPPAHLGDCVASLHPSPVPAGDSSLTAFGSLLESPVKGGFVADSQDSMVGRAVDALMSESSAEYCRKFADLADRIASSDR